MALPEYTPRSPLERLSIERFKGRTYSQESLTVAPDTVGMVLPNNPNRLHWVIINEGLIDARLSNSPDITTLSGWLLPANGGVIEMDWETDGESVGYALYAIGVAGHPTIRMREVIIE